MEKDEFEEQLEQEKLEKIKAEESASNTYTDKDGTVYEWDYEKNAWFPKIDDDFIAKYQMQYGTAEPATTNDTVKEGTDDGNDNTKYSQEYYDYYQNYYQYYCNTETNDSSNTEGSAAVNEKTAGEGKLEGEEKETKEHHGSDDQSAENDEYYKQYHEYYRHYYGDDYHKYYDYYAKQYYENKDQAKDGAQIQEEDQGQEEGGDNKKGGKGKKRKLAPQPKKPEVWFEVEEEKNTNVYVSGLPTDITEDEYKELMNKCGLIMFDPFTKKPKLKLYRDSNGELKGDGLCCYIKVESVNLALQILDGSQFRGKTLHVEPAKFELKGNFDPKKRKRLSNKDKKKMKEKQKKLFDWRPEKTIDHRFKFEKVVVLKNMFSPKEFEEDPTLINELRDDVRTESSKFGEVKNVKIFDNHPEGVMTVAFKEPEHADACIEALNGRWFSKRRISAETWDGNTKYEIEESEAEREKRLEKWENFLETSEKSEKSGDSKEKSETEYVHQNLKKTESEVIKESDIDSIQKSSDNGKNAMENSVEECSEDNSSVAS